MKYRVIIRPKWTFSNNAPTNMWRVEVKLFGLFWVENFDKWHTRKEAEQWIADRKKII